jgi:hypothetical protein
MIKKGDRCNVPKRFIESFGGRCADYITVQKIDDCVVYFKLELDYGVLSSSCFINELKLYQE